MRVKLNIKVRTHMYMHRCMCAYFASNKNTYVYVSTYPKVLSYSS